MRYREGVNDTTYLRRAVEDATRILDGIRPDQLDGSTPCEDFTVQQLVTHVVEGAEMMTTHLDGGPPSADQSWGSVSKRLVAAGELGAPDDVISLPYGEFPRSVVVQQAYGEILIHAADLARATGQTIGDDAAYERVFDVVNDVWRTDGVLGPERPCASDAPLADRVLAFAGRKI